MATLVTPTDKTEKFEKKSPPMPDEKQERKPRPRVDEKFRFSAAPPTKLWPMKSATFWA